jgi:hypothetical protein
MLEMGDGRDGSGGDRFLIEQRPAKSGVARIRLIAAFDENALPFSRTRH